MNDPPAPTPAEQVAFLVRLIAEQFIELYWRQCAPYGQGVADGSYGTLIQNTGKHPPETRRRCKLSTISRNDHPNGSIRVAALYPRNPK